MHNSLSFTNKWYIVHDQMVNDFTVIHYVKDRRYIRQKAGRIIYAHRLCGLRRWVVFRYAALRWGGVISVSGFCNLTSLGLIP